jgi:cytochrome c-type biogenesis protein CcmH
LPRALLLLAFLALCGAAAADDGAVERAYDEAARTILCDCGCHPQSVHDCACRRAAEMRDEIRGLASTGLSGAAIIVRYVAQYGPQIRVTPTATGFNLLPWLGPLVALVAGSLGLVFVLRRWTRRTAAESAAAPEPAPPAPPGDPYRERLERALERFE